MATSNQNTNFDVSISIVDGMREGSFSIAGIVGAFPQHAMTSTNNGHQKKTGVVVNFGTNVFEEIIRAKEISTLFKSTQRSELVSKLNKAHIRNKGNIVMMALSGAGSKRLVHEDNIELIKAQLDSGLTFVRVYIKKSKGALQNLQTYFSLIPEGKFLVPTLDEKLDHSIFKDLYEYCKGKTPLIAIFGRDWTGKDMDIINNISFLSVKNTDPILRLVSGISKRRTSTGVAIPFKFKLMCAGDITSFATNGIGRYNIPKKDAEIMYQRRYVKVNDFRSLPCPIYTGKTIGQTLDDFAQRDEESIPCSIFSIQQLNVELRNTKNRQDLLNILKEEVKLFNQ